MPRVGGAIYLNTGVPEVPSSGIPEDDLCHPPVFPRSGVWVDVGSHPPELASQFKFILGTVVQSGYIIGGVLNL